MWEQGIISFAIMEILPGEDFLAFNYFFTLTWIFGIYSLVIGLLVKLLTRT